MWECVLLNSLFFFLLYDRSLEYLQVNWLAVSNFNGFNNEINNMQKEKFSKMRYKCIWTIIFIPLCLYFEIRTHGKSGYIRQVPIFACSSLEGPNGVYTYLCVQKT